MYHFKSIHLIFLSLFLLTKCNSIGFYPDPDDQGLSRFTSRGYNVATEYINGLPYSNLGAYYPLLRKDNAVSSTDTLRFTWRLNSDNNPNAGSLYDTISFMLPVSPTFNKENLLGYNGQRFLNTIPFVLKSASSGILAGNATLYFVAVTSETSTYNEKYIKLSGLFDGNIGDTVLVTKGRFDFEIQESQLNF